MTTSSVLHHPREFTAPVLSGPRYSLFVSSEPHHRTAAQRLRRRVFAAEPGFTLPPSDDDLDADRFDEFCDHLLVQDHISGDVVGCYRMLPPEAAHDAGGYYTATEFDLTALDPYGLGAVETGRARADLLEWGVLGVLARKMHVIPIDRRRLRQLPAVVERIRFRLRDGERVTVFPEGTTWCGRAYGGFRPALLVAAVAEECPVQPVGLRYLDSAGALTTGPAFVGDETITSSIHRAIRSRGTVAEVVLAPLELPGTDRRDLAARCDLAARGPDEGRPARCSRRAVGRARRTVGDRMSPGSRR